MAGLLRLTVLAVALIAVLGAVQADDSEKKKITKLQIGVKKRAEHCETKSKKGDVLHMHYTVS